MKKLFLITFLLPIFLNANLLSDNCITYKNMKSVLLDGELIEVKGTRYWGHGEEIKYYIFRLNKVMCFDDGNGHISTDEIHVILNDKQYKNLNNLLDSKSKIQIEDFLWGGTQHWKRPIGVLKAKFIQNSG